MRPIQTLFSFLIVAAHIGTLVVFYWNKPPPFQEKKRLVVRTQLPQKVVVQPQNPAHIQPVATPIVKPQPKSLSKPKAKPVAKAQPAKKKAPKKKVKAKPAPAPQMPAIPQNLLDQLEESIAKIDQKSHKVNTKSNLIVPTFERLAVSKKGGGEASYAHKLIECLHRSLALPDHGEVTLELTLSSLGVVENLKIVTAESAKNREYLEKHVPQVVFPPLEGGDAKNPQKRFVLTFCNEI